MVIGLVQTSTADSWLSGDFADISIEILSFSKNNLPNFYNVGGKNKKMLECHFFFLSEDSSTIEYTDTLLEADN